MPKGSLKYKNSPPKNIFIDYPHSIYLVVRGWRNWCDPIKQNCNSSYNSYKDSFEHLFRFQLDPIHINYIYTYIYTSICYSLIPQAQRPKMCLGLQDHARFPEPPSSRQLLAWSARGSASTVSRQRYLGHPDNMSSRSNPLPLFLKGPASTVCAFSSADDVCLGFSSSTLVRTLRLPSL